MLDFDPYDFSKKEMGGVSVYYKNIPSAPCINIRVVFNTGSFDDPIGKEGLSHFFEHLIFNGSPTLSDKKAIREWRRQYTLNSWNAWTNYYHTNFWLRCLPEKYETALVGMKDMIFHSFLRAEDVEHERKVITQEAWNRFLNEKYLAYNKEFIDNIFHGHEHERMATPLGWPETIANITHEDILSFYTRHYGIGNFFIVITGDIQESHIEMLGQFLKDLPNVLPTTKNIGIISKPKKNRFVKRADEIGEMKEQVEITILRTSDALPFEKNEIASLSTRLLNDILHERLRIDHSLCYNVSVGIALDKTYSQIYMNVKTNEKNIELIEKEFANVLQEIKDKKFTDRFEVIKKVYAEQIRSQEMLSADVTNAALREISRYNRIITSNEQLANIEKTTSDDIITFLNWAFDRDYMYTEIILPSKK